jgi:tRNA (mo5U34)-methyltransferase
MSGPERSGAVRERDSGMDPNLDREREIRRRVAELGDWFHNLDLEGVKTAPDHFLGDYPSVKWREFAHAIPADLTGWSVLDIGCNAGFYSHEMKRRGASRVLGIDSDERYLAQARFAADVAGLDIEFQQLSVYQIPLLEERFDLVLFMGVLYHLRYPLLALDILHAHAVRQVLVFQSMLRGSSDSHATAGDYDFSDRSPFADPAYPQLYFVERRYAGDPTNWWIPNRAGAEAMLRAAGFEVADHPEEEVFICRRVDPDPPFRVRPEELPWLKP